MSYGNKTVKELHVGKCLNDLTYALPEAINKYNIDKLCKSTQKLHSMAQMNNQNGDEEMAYIFYMKYLNMIEYIKKRPEFEKHREFVNKFIGRANVVKALDNVEKLSTNLNRRYDVNNDVRLNHKQDEANGMMDHKQYDAGIKEEKMDIEMNIFVYAGHLYNMLRNRDVSLLIVDCRPEIDFTNSKIICKYCCNVPEEIIQNGMTAGKIGTLLNKEMKSQWASRHCQDTIVLMDWSTNNQMENTRSAIWTLHDILLNWDQDLGPDKHIFILDGGYEEFMLQYPALTSNSLYQPPSKKIIESNLIHDVEYPSLKDIAMKDTLVSNQFNQLPHSKPFIDRSSKNSALEVLQQKESLANKVVENAKSILVTESQLSELQVDNKNEFIENELTYQILEMKNQQKDYQLRISDLEQTIVTLRNEAATTASIGQQILPDEAQRLEKEAEQRIASKEAEEKILTERLQNIEKERETKLNESRKYPKPMVQIDATPKPPAYPIFDRGSKPLVNNVGHMIVRDFSPERGCKGKGLTGLKNLGNTCYMNSIMQCLSNTELLVDYLITGNYKINRTNKTKGKIAEEVSAVLKEIWCAQYKYISSKNFRNMVGEFHQLFRGMGQQDSHEFLTILMDWLHSDLQFINKTDIPKGKLTPADKAWQDFIQSKESYILKLFYGQIKSTVKCVECSRESATYEGFSNLSLELPANSNRCDIFECMKLYFYGEKIRGWNCPTCKVKRDAIKKLDISKLPPILVIHLKRFYADNDSLSSVFKKKQTYVDFPLNGFNVREYVAPSELPNMSSKNFFYNLYSVSNHYGVLERGHCTAFCKSRVFNRWFKFDDHRVSEIDESDVVSSAAYILFYTTHDTSNNQYKPANKL